MYLALPYLHPELVQEEFHLPAGALFVWPGLPAPVQEGRWTPDYAWSPAEAAACLADFERLGRDGGGGAPVQAAALASMKATPGLSAAELRALSEFQGHTAPAPEQDRRIAAQRALLLAWLQESQLLEVRALERKVAQSKAQLAGFLGDGVATETARGFLAGDATVELPPPAWPLVLAAVAALLPDPSQDDAPIRLAVNSPIMAKELSALIAQSGGKAKAGMVSASLPLWRALGLPRPLEGTEREALFDVPAAWLEEGEYHDA